MIKENQKRFLAEDDQITFQSAKSLCKTCVHKTPGKSTCEEFPKGIPKDTLKGKPCATMINKE